jgi:putative glutamine amidotransferase
MTEGRPVIGISMDVQDEYLRLKHHYVPAMLAAGGTPILLPPCGDALIFVSIIDGLFIPGGGDMDPSYYSEKARPGTAVVPRQRTDFEISLLRAIMELRKPVFGVCYGMQLINVALGGSLYQDIESQIAASVDHTKGSHTITGNGEWLRGEFVVNTSHHQAVKELGQNLKAAAVAEDGLVEAIHLPDYPFLCAVQWHPERSSDELSSRLFRSFVEAACGCK